MTVLTICIFYAYIESLYHISISTVMNVLIMKAEWECLEVLNQTVWILIRFLGFVESLMNGEGQNIWK
jgi:hypothetical protein